MKNYNLFKIKAIPFNAELISSIMWILDIEGTQELENEIYIFANAEQNVTKQEISAILEKLKKENLIQNYEIAEEICENKNWNEVWEKSLNIIEVTNKIVIKPTSKKYLAKPGQIVITLDPKMSFGTGEHQTTRIMLKLIEKYIKKDDYVLDVGSGTGVLAIASVKLGAAKAIAIDNDEWCLDNGRENVELNDVKYKVDIRLGEIEQVQEKAFSLIVANINKHILLDIKESIYDKMEKGGRLILSGLLDIDYDDIMKNYLQLGLKQIDIIQMDEWLGLVFNK
ncbi:MAG: 50S ribosomal protein L11 methyltransferase [Ignavibacteriales bacterium]|nr:50S ribosomal protein L11 methyltransferase [Ignavibacteriales bacterium]